MNWFTQPDAPTQSDMTIWDTVLIAVITVVVSAVLIIGIQIILAFVASLFRGFQKLLQFLYLSYTFIWNLAVGVCTLALFLLVLFLVYVWFVEEKTRLQISQAVSDAAPNAAEMLLRAKTIVSVAAQYKDVLMKINANSTSP